MKKFNLCFAMCYENTCHTEEVEFEDDVTEEELEHAVEEMVLEYANTWFYEIK